MDWFTADWHLDHRNIINICKRPFVDLQEMQNIIINNVNNMFSPGDTLFILGDTVLGDRWNKLNRLREDINIIILFGNHDMHIKTKHLECIKKDNIIIHQNLYRFHKINNIQVVLSHFPSNLTYESSRCGINKVINVIDDASYHCNIIPRICGHVHENWKEKENQLNVGVDVWDFKPVSELEVLEWLKRR